MAGLAAAGLAMPGAIAAHGGTAAIVILPSTVSPGEPVDVFGEDLAADAPVILVLRAPDGDRRLGDGRTDAEGHVSIRAVIPPDLASRYYEVWLTDEVGTTAVASIQVTGRPEGSRVLDGLLPLVGAGAILVGGVSLVVHRRGRAPGSGRAARVGRERAPRGR